MNERCEAVRDQLPALAAGRLDDGGAARLSAHVAACSDCAAELEVVRLLNAHEVVVPAGLEQRIRRARAQSAMPQRWWSPGRLAMAATVVFALVTAGVLQGRLGNGAPAEGTPTVAGVDDGSGDGLAAPIWPSVDEPLMRSGPALYQLSVDELEALLKELES